MSNPYELLKSPEAIKDAASGYRIVRTMGAVRGPGTGLIGEAAYPLLTGHAAPATTHVSAMGEAASLAKLGMERVGMAALPALEGVATAASGVGDIAAAGYLTYRGGKATLDWAEHHVMDTPDQAAAKGLANDGNGSLDALANGINGTRALAKEGYRAVKMDDPNSAASDASGSLDALRNLGGMVKDGAKALGKHMGLGTDEPLKHSARGRGSLKAETAAVPPVAAPVIELHAPTTINAADGSVTMVMSGDPCMAEAAAAPDVSSAAAAMRRCQALRSSPAPRL